MSEFSGRVYDGPWEGRNYAYDRPYFRVALIPRMSVCDFRFRDVVTAVDVHNAEYRWSYPLRAWVLDWNSIPAHMRRAA